MNLIKFYNNAYKKGPFLTHAIESGLVMGAGDIMAQTLVENKSLQNTDIPRTLRFGLTGLCLFGPVRVAWYKYLEQKFPDKKFTTVVKKVIVDQSCFAPTAVLLLITSVNYLNGMTTKEVTTKLGQSYKDILLNNWKVWPAVQMFNFYVVPVHMRMSFAQCAALLWNIYLSWKTNKR